MAHKPDDRDIDEIIYEAIDRVESNDVQGVLKYIQKNYGIEEEKVLSRMKKLAKEKKIVLEEPIPLTESFSKYILGRRSWEFWIVVLTSMAVYLAALSIQEGSTLIPLRWLFGLFFLLFIPGYSLVQALYPREEDLDKIERAALSIGLSIAIVPLTALILNYTPYKIRLIPILTSLCFFSNTSILVATLRKYFLIRKR